MATLIIITACTRRLKAMQELMRNSSDKLSHITTMEYFRESTFVCEVRMISLSNVTRIKKSSGFKSDEEGGISLCTRIELCYLRRTFGIYQTSERDTVLIPLVVTPCVVCIQP
uniref:Uncharacterized protein n=1 Tax=Lepeophtheirus salmonis TaxID=72036 RepID=A0A0K2U6S6_LEPSM